MAREALTLLPALCLHASVTGLHCPPVPLPQVQLLAVPLPRILLSILSPPSLLAQDSVLPLRLNYVSHFHVVVTDTQDR